ncbi:hypothetical protein LAZ67_5004421 [Cordylochernes scorpioides]|uniref:Uncharacterized protein n=1 Tax=Cordylochernes scorpioides TaxID=51811 RepID=A0ABY6KI07_9ARAC|nr:hypothetical protein LAZ67_5004421 [Cordylochernes scorpioides]
MTLYHPVIWLTQRMMDTNYFSAVHTTRAVLPGMKERQEGRVVFVSSIAGVFGLYGYTAYSASKFALVKPYNLQVTVALPSDTDTPGFAEEEKIKVLSPQLCPIISLTLWLSPWRPRNSQSPADSTPPEVVARKILQDAVPIELTVKFADFKTKLNKMKYYKDRTGVTLMDCSMAYWQKVITALLIIGCVELNPGPKRQATLTNMPHSTPDQAPMDDLKLLIINLSAEVNRLGEKLDARLLNIEQKMEDWDRRMTGMETSIASCTDALATNTRSISHNTLKIRNLEERAEALERRARENNLIIYGIESAETDSRELLLQKVKKLIAEDMQIADDVVIAECHRLGRGPKAPILIEVPDHESRISLLKNSSKLRILNIFMSRDYSLQIREQRKILIERRKELYKKALDDELLIVRYFKFCTEAGRMRKNAGQGILEDDPSAGKFLSTVGLEGWFIGNVCCGMTPADSICQLVTQPVKDYRLSTVTYGTTSAPFLAIRTMQQLARDESHEFPEASRVALKDFYVDDLLTEFHQQAEGFTFRKWNSNCQELVSQMNSEKRTTENESSNSATLKVLGILWDTTRDAFGIQLRKPSEVTTKRDLLSNIARIFDPLDFLSPTTGPSWLKDKVLDKFEYLDDKKIEEEEKEVALSYHLQTMSVPEYFKKYSSFVKLKRVTVWCLGFMTNCQPSTEEKEYGPLTTSEMSHTIMTIIKLVQCSEFPQEIQSLKDQIQHQNEKRILDLAPFLDSVGLLRVGGRKQRADSLKPSLIRSRKVMKSYIVIFVCFAVKAILLEMLTSLSTNSFNGALRRFVSRRGKPSDIYSDKGTHFKGANRILVRRYEVMNSRETKEFLSEELISCILYHHQLHISEAYGRQI